MKLLTIDQLAGRLAGGFLQPIDSDHLAAAVGESIGLPLREMDEIKTLPSFQLEPSEARHLLDAIDITTVIGLRDRALIWPRSIRSRASA